MNPRSDERGTALVSAILITVIMFGLASAFHTASVGGIEVSARELETSEARLAAEEGLHRAMAEIKSGVDAGGDGLGTISMTGTDGRTITVTSSDLGGNLYRLHSVAVLLRARAGADALVERTPTGTYTFPARAAITSNGPVTVTGSIVVDGRDWNSSGTAILSPGTFGISSVMSILNQGNAKVGGKGIAPAKPPPATTVEPNANWSDSANNDGDGLVDEEAFDGIDNDHDGKTDEDTNSYPTTPDVMLHLAPGTLRAAAQAAGTYFSTQAQFDTWLAANGGVMPSSKIIYADFPTWLPVNLGSTLNASPSVIVHHSATGDALMKNVHGAFKGVLLCDYMEHLNGDFALVGAIMSFGNQAIGNAYGNGNATIKYSSSVLGGLPAAGTASTVRIMSWSHSAAQ